MTRATRLSLGLLVIAILSLPIPGPSSACAPVMPRGTSAQIATESAIIIWDASKKTQHFIRRAVFDTSLPNLGFLVPTPSVPKLEAADDDAFKILEKATEPKVVTRERSRREYRTKGAMKGMAVDEEALMEASGVRVIGKQRVGNLEATILEADDAKALNKWLGENGYDSRPELVDWLVPYVKAKWKLTAFKIIKDSPWDASVATNGVRMSFETEKPFFPYSEPTTSAPFPPWAGGPGGSGGPPGSPGRLLRVYFLGDVRVTGTIGAADLWPHNVPWADRLDTATQEALLDKVKLPRDAAPKNAWLTEFEDHSSPRPGKADVYFSPSGDQMTIARPPIINWVDPVIDPTQEAHQSVLYVGAVAGGIIVLLVAGALILWRKDPLPA
jgi:hypothetical protein